MKKNTLRTIAVCLSIVGGLITVPTTVAAVSDTNGSLVTVSATTARVASIVSSNTAPGMLTTDFIVQTSDIERAGYRNVERILPQTTRFLEPVRYFRVAKETVSSSTDRSKDCPDCDTLLAVYVTRASTTNTPVWTARGNPLIQEFGNRLQLRWFAANRTIFITAPGDSLLLRTLGSQLRERAVLGKNN